jgi:hypothetical protein
MLSVIQSGRWGVGTSPPNLTICSSQTPIALAIVDPVYWKSREQSSVERPLEMPFSAVLDGFIALDQSNESLRVAKVRG